MRAISSRQWPLYPFTMYMHEIDMRAPRAHISKLYNDIRNSSFELDTKRKCISSVPFHLFLSHSRLLLLDWNGQVPCTLWHFCAPVIINLSPDKFFKRGIADKTSSLFSFVVEFLYTLYWGDTRAHTHTVNCFRLLTLFFPLSVYSNTKFSLISSSCTYRSNAYIRKSN